MAKIVLVDAEKNGQKRDTFLIYDSSKCRKKEEKISKYWIIFIKFKVNIASKLFTLGIAIHFGNLMKLIYSK